MEVTSTNGLEFHIDSAAEINDLAFEYKIQIKNSVDEIVGITAPILHDPQALPTSGDIAQALNAATSESIAETYELSLNVPTSFMEDPDGDGEVAMPFDFAIRILLGDGTREVTTAKIRYPGSDDTAGTNWEDDLRGEIQDKLNAEYLKGYLTTDGSPYTNGADAVADVKTGFRVTGKGSIADPWRIVFPQDLNLLPLQNNNAGDPNDESVRIIVPMLQGAADGNKFHFDDVSSAFGSGNDDQTGYEGYFNIKIKKER